MTNLKQNIDSHNKSILHDKKDEQTKSCNCRKPSDCPLAGNCPKESQCEGNARTCEFSSGPNSKNKMTRLYMANVLLSTDEMIEMFQGKVSSGLQSAIKLLLRGELKLNLCQGNKLSANFFIIYIK